MDKNIYEEALRILGASDSNKNHLIQEMFHLGMFDNGERSPLDKPDKVGLKKEAYKKLTKNPLMNFIISYLDYFTLDPNNKEPSKIIIDTINGRNNAAKKRMEIRREQRLPKKERTTHLVTPWNIQDMDFNTPHNKWVLGQDEDFIWDNHRETVRDEDPTIVIETENKENNTIKITFVSRTHLLETLLNDRQTTTLITYILSKMNSNLKITKETVEYHESNMKKLKEMLETSVKNSIKSLRNSEEQIMESEINQIRKLETQKRSLEEDIERAEEKLKKIEERFLLGSNDSKNETMERILNLYKKYDVITNVVVKNNELNIHLDDIKMQKYQRDFIDNQRDKIFQTLPEFKEAFMKMHDGEADLFMGSAVIVLTKNGDQLVTSVKPNHRYYVNPHANIRCRGSFDETISEMEKEMDIEGIIRMYIEYMQTVNFTDIGISNIFKSCYIQSKQGEILYDSKEEGYEVVRSHWLR